MLKGAKMKILQVIASFPPAFAYGGPARVAYDISKELVKKGHEVTVYTTDVLNKSSRYNFESNPIWLDGIEVYYFRNVSNYFASNCGITCSPEMLLAFKNNLRNFDLVHCHEYRAFEAVLLHHYAKKYQIPYILQAHGAALPMFQKQKLKNMFDFCFGSNLLNDASKLIAVTITEAKQYAKLGFSEDKIEIVPNGIFLSEYENLPEKGIFRNKYGITSNEKIVLYLGRIHRIKGINLLVEAFSDLISKVDGVKLVIAGPDDGFLSTLKIQIEKLNIGDRIVFTGPLYERDKLEAYVDADVYVLPSVYEIFGVAVLEACACGTPAIVTDRCGISDFVEKVGYVVESDKNELSNALFKVLFKESIREKFGEKSNKLLQEQFSWDKIVINLESLYMRLRLCDKS